MEIIIFISTVASTILTTAAGCFFLAKCFETIAKGMDEHTRKRVEIKIMKRKADLK